MADYIPSNEGDRILWLGHFAAWMNGHGVAHGFTGAEVSMMYFKASQVRSRVDIQATQQGAVRAAVLAKQEAIAKAVGVARDMARRLQADPGMTDAERAAAGITVPDAIRTAASPDAIRTTDPPSLRLDFSKRLQAVIHWGPNLHDERHNGRPQGMIGCEIQFHRGGIPEHEDDWTTLDADSDSPYVHTVHEDTATTYAYRACYIGKTLKRGPFSNVAECTVSV